MATRKIDTELALSGEAEFKSAMKDVNSTLAVTKSEMDLVTAEFGKNNNSMAALTAQSKVLSDQLEAGNVSTLYVIDITICTLTFSYARSMDVLHQHYLNLLEERIPESFLDFSSLLCIHVLILKYMRSHSLLHFLK